MRTAVKRVGYADYVKAPADGRRHEIIGGEWYVAPAPGIPHQNAALNLAVILKQHATANKLGRVIISPVDVLLSKADIVQPDLIFVSSDRSSIVTEDNVKGAPDLVIEILSPSTAAIDRGVKRELYERSGVKEYWLVDPATRSIEVHEFSSPRRTSVHTGERSFESALLPGLHVRPKDVF